MRRSGLLVIAILALVAAPAAAQAVVYLKDGRILKGFVVEDDGKKVKVRLATGGAGTATATFPHDELHPKTLFRVKFNRTGRDDARGHLSLARYALANELLPSARLSYDLAKKANAERKAGLDDELAALYARAPGVVINWARKKIDAGEHRIAERYLSRLCQLWPQTSEASIAHKMLEEIAAQCLQARHAARKRRAGKASKTAEEAAAPAKKHYDHAHALVRRSLGGIRNQSQAIATMREAIREFDKAQRLLAKALKKEGEDSDLASHYDAWSVAIASDTIETHLHIASAYTGRSSYQNALREINKALAIDPENADALAARSRTELAAAMSGRWRW